LTSSVTHVWRIARWGRTLGAHGALRGIERAQAAPASVRRLAWLARLGTFAPKTPRYAEAFTRLGPAAIKLGQALATRPDLVGEAAAKDFAALQDRLPPEPFERIRAGIEAGLEQPIAALYSRIDPVAVGAASVAQVHRAVTTDGRDVAIKVLRPGVEARIARDTDTFAWLAYRVEALGGEAARLRPRAVIEAFRRWTERELDLRMEAASASELAEDPGD
jgi:ubiquinone biosynthesis protein